MKQAFLSYAHLDNGALGPGAEGWVSFFYQALTLELQEKGYNSKIVVWLDLERMKSHELAPQLIDKISSSSALLAIVSPNYTMSPYCQMEINEFLSSSPAGKVLLIAKRPFKVGDLPEALHTHVYLPFYDVKPGIVEIDDFFLGYGKELRPEYWTSVRRAAKELIGKIEENTDGLDEAIRGTVFLNFTGRQMYGQRARLRQELINRGFRVVPDGSPPVTADAFERVIGEAVLQSDLAIHLLGQADDPTPEGGTASINTVQLMATDKKTESSETYQRLIWPDDWKGDALSIRRLDQLVRRPLEIFITTALQALEKTTGVVPPVARSDSTRSLALLFHPSDKPELIDMITDCAERIGFATEGFFIDDAHVSGAALRKDGLVICWENADKTQISEAVSSALGVKSARVGMLKMKPDTPEQRYFRNPNLTFNLAFDQNAVGTLDAALKKLRGV